MNIITMHKFGNSILIVVFNCSNCVHNKNTIQTIYGKHFKKIIFYSDYPIILDNDVNFIEIKAGFYVHKIFYHLYKNYRSLIDESDGIFYTMDDNIINVNILNSYNTEKIIFYYNEIKTLDNYSGWHWDNDHYGKNAIYKLLNDDNFKKYNINKFCGSFADWFYLPKKYLTDTLFDLFYLFSKYNVFLEIAIPSIINNIETDKLNYQLFTNEILWGNDRDKFLNKEYIINSLNNNNNLVIHPIKFNKNPISANWLKDIFL